MQINKSNFGKRIVISLVFVLLSLFICKESFARVLRVGIVHPIFPFAIQSDQTYSGIATDIWNIIASNEKINYQYILLGYDTEAALRALIKGDIDVLIGPVSVTYERSKRVAFSYPFFLNEVGIVEHKATRDMLDLILVLFDILKSPFFICLIIFFLIYTNILWLFERGRMRHCSKNYRKGVSHVFWSHLLQKGVKELPYTFSGKLVSLTWVLTAAVLVTLLLATVTSQLTLALVNSQGSFVDLGDIQNQKVAAVKGTHSVIEAKKAGVSLVQAQNLAEAIEWLAQGKVAAVAEDYIIAKTYIKTHNYPKLQLSSLTLANDGYAFVVRKNDPLLELINNQILFLQDNDYTVAMCAKYISSDAKLCKL